MVLTSYICWDNTRCSDGEEPSTVCYRRVGPDAAPRRTMWFPPYVGRSVSLSVRPSVRPTITLSYTAWDCGVRKTEDNVTRLTRHLPAEIATNRVCVMRTRGLSRFFGPRQHVRSRDSRGRTDGRPYRQAVIDVVLTMTLVAGWQVVWWSCRCRWHREPVGREKRARGRN